MLGLVWVSEGDRRKVWSSELASSRLSSSTDQAFGLHRCRMLSTEVLYPTGTVSFDPLPLLPESRRQRVPDASPPSFPFCHSYLLSSSPVCRYNSGFFFRHPLLQNVKFYWRIEPSVKFFCDLREHHVALSLLASSRAVIESSPSHTFRLHSQTTTLSSLWKMRRRCMVSR